MIAYVKEHAATDLSSLRYIAGMTWWINEIEINSKFQGIGSLKHYLLSKLYESKSHGAHSFAAKLFFKKVESEVYRKSGTGVCRVSKVMVTKFDNLPNLSWIGIQSQDGWVFKIGSGVELTSFGLYEGIWSGDYENTSPIQSETAFGSGVILNHKRDDTLCFLVPKNPYEQVWVLQNSDTTYVSNSLAFVLEEAHIDPKSKLAIHLNDRLVLDTFENGRLGVDKCKVLCAEIEQWKLFRFVYFDFTINTHGILRRLWSKPLKLPTHYYKYKKFLQTVLDLLQVNATDENRTCKLTPIVAISSGYDSTGVASIIRLMPDLLAVTMDVRVLGVDDSGSGIASLLGIPVTTYPHVISRDISNLRFDFTGKLQDDVLEFVGTAGIGDDIAFLAFEDSLKNGVLHSGNYGDSIYSLEKNLKPGLSLKIPFGKSLGEFRLRVGFSHVPVPTIGARFNYPVKKLSRSRRMRSWSIGGIYDRPIPRRMGEDEGLPREVFGISKAATAPLAMNHHSLFPEGLDKVRKRYTTKE